MVTAQHTLIPSKVSILSLAVTRTGLFEWFVCQNVKPLKEINNSNTDDLHSLSERPESLPIITVAWKDILHSGSLWPFPPPHYLFHQEDNYSVESQIFFPFEGKYRCALRLPPSSSLHFCPRSPAPRSLFVAASYQSQTAVAGAMRWGSGLPGAWPGLACNRLPKPVNSIWCVAEKPH